LRVTPIRPSAQSLLTRFVAKLGANLAALVVQAATLLIAARFLGPTSFGRFEFLANFFQQTTSLLDTGTSAAFYSKLSQHPEDRGRVVFYGRFVVALSTLLLLAATMLAASPLGASLWAGEPVSMVVLAATLGCLVWWAQVVRKMVDAYGLTVRGEFMYALIRLTAVGVLAAVAFTGFLGLEIYFVYQIAIPAVAIIAWYAFVLREPLRAATADEGSRAYAREFWDYCHPLLTYAVIGAAAGLAERWLLQTVSGAAEQAFYGLAYQVGAVCFVFTSALTQLLTREYAIAWSIADRSRMASLFARTLPSMYALTTYFSVFVALHAGEVVRLVGGHEYAGAVMPMAILALYPIHQTYGQLSGAVFYATGQTRLYRNIGIAMMVLGLLLAAWLILPADDGGQGLGATGLAVKMVLIQFVAVNVQLWFNARLLGLSFTGLLAHQASVVLVFAACAWAAAGFAGMASELDWMASFLLSGFLYTLAVASLCWLFPSLGGQRREDLRALLRRLRRVSGN